MGKCTLWAKVPRTSYLGLSSRINVKVKRNGLLLKTKPMAISNRMLEVDVWAVG